MSEVREKLDWFKAVILPHQAALRARLRRMAAAHELDDLVAEALARAYANPNWRHVDRGRGYLATIARNLVIDQVRRERVVSIAAATDIDRLRCGLDLEAQLCARDSLRRLQRALDGLPAQRRRAFVLRRMEEKSYLQVADEMGLSVSTVEKHVAKAVALLMRTLAEHGDDAGEQAGGTGATADRGGGDQATGRARR